MFVYKCGVLVGGEIFYEPNIRWKRKKKGGFCVF